MFSPSVLPRSACAQRRSFIRNTEAISVPDLIQVQRNSYERFQNEGLRELFDEISPIRDYTGSRLDLYFLDHEFGEPECSQEECLERDLTWSAPLKVKIRLIAKETGEIKEQDLYMGDFPIMTDRGSFIINGAERVVVNQLIRSPGVYFTVDTDPVTGQRLCSARLIPESGVWIEFDMSNQGIIFAKVNHKRKVPVTTLLRALGYGRDEDLLSLFADVESMSSQPFIKLTIDRDPSVKNEGDALIEMHKRWRPGEPPTMEAARGLINALFFDPRRYRLGKSGRYKLNRRLGLDRPLTQQLLTPEDIVAVMQCMILVNKGLDDGDDIDHLSNRRVRAVGELLQNQLRMGLLRVERAVRERMSLVDASSATPNALVNNRAMISTVRDFFNTSRLSQFMDQTNPLAELTHKRRLSSLGPGGFSKERAGFEVRDVHHSHYGRICPIETPEGRNIGLITSLATYARVNEYGFIETPYRRVIKEMDGNSPELLNRTIRESVLDSQGQLIAEAGAIVDQHMAQKLAGLPSRQIPVKPFVSSKVEYLPADEEDKYIIAQANVGTDENGQILDERVEVRHGKRFLEESPQHVRFTDISTSQTMSVSTSLIPFLENDDANRALMGSNMQRQAVPIILPESPIVGTGMEREVARGSGQVVLAPVDGDITSVTATEVILSGDDDKQYIYFPKKFARSNQGTCITQYPRVSKGNRVRKGQVLIDGSCSDNGELALGRNVLCAFLNWEGYTFEDAIVISEGLAWEDKFTSIHIEKYEVEARETKLGPEEVTRDIPNVSEANLRNLDEYGIIRIGAKVSSGDILVGKITPKGERVLTAEEKLLRAIFGEKARDVKDTSLRMPHGDYGKVIGIKTFSKENQDRLDPGVIKMIRVFVAQKRRITEGDKLAGRHGNKGVIAKVLPVEDMPYLPDGRPVDVVLSPLGVPSRMNIGQLLEAHLGWASYILGFKALTPVFNGADELTIEEALAQAWFIQRADEDHSIDCADQIKRAKIWLAQRGFNGKILDDESSKGEAKHVCLKLWLEEQGVKGARDLDDKALEQTAKELSHKRGVAPPTTGKTSVYDGRTGEPFASAVTVGYMYIMKLVHLVEDKIHARSTGPYSLVTQQPLGGKSQFGGQRVGEMEVWALEAYGAAFNLQEILTIKSDDVIGRVKTYSQIIKGEESLSLGAPESFKVLVNELRSLGLGVEIIFGKEGISYGEIAEEVPMLGADLRGMEIREGE